MNSEYYRGLYKYSSHENKNNQNFEDDDLKSKDPNHGVFRFYGECDFDNFDRFSLKECGWEVAHSLTPQQKEFLKTIPGYKDHKETVNYRGPQGYAIMHRNYLTNIHKLIIHPNKLENYPDSVNSIKNIFELGLGRVCYDEENLPKELEMKIKRMKESKLIKKIKSN